MFNTKIPRRPLRSSSVYEDGTTNSDCSPAIPCSLNPANFRIQVTMASKTLQFLYRELGVRTLLHSSIDVKLLCLQRFVRLAGYGAGTIILVLYLSKLGNSDARIGAFMSLTLLGDVVISFLLTLFADGLGRRRILMLGAVLMSASGVVFAFSGNFWVLLLASILGVISPSGNEVGPFKAVEESTLAQLTSLDARSDILAWYTIAGTLGVSGGTLACGFVVDWLQSRSGWTALDSYRAIFGAYAALGVIKFALALLLSRECEPHVESKGGKDAPRSDSYNGEEEPLLRDSETLPQIDGDISQNGSVDGAKAVKASNEPEVSKTSLLPKLSVETRKLILKLCLLFAIDSLASGLMNSSWIAYFFNQRYHTPEAQLGTLLFTTALIASISNIFAASIARRIGFIQTMVLTHLPSSVLLCLIPVPRTVSPAMVFLILRSCINSMDQAPRQAFLSAAVLPHERTAVMGAVNVVKTLSQSAGPVVTGTLAAKGKFWVAFVAAGALKGTYDISLVGMFWGYKTGEQRRADDAADAEDGEEEANQAR